MVIYEEDDRALMARILENLLKLWQNNTLDKKKFEELGEIYSKLCNFCEKEFIKWEE